jgi:hypothetical protein
VTLSAIAEACGVNKATAGQVRQWVRSVSRWPSVDGKGARPKAVRPIGPSRLTRADWS